MRSRRSFARILFFGGVAVALSAALDAYAQVSAEKLFFIQRSKNANEVHYDARVKADGTLDAKDPVEGYWLNKAEDGSRKPISLVQRIAYGYDVSSNNDGTYTMTLKAFPGRTLRLQRYGGKWRALATIGGHTALMTRLYVATDESGVMPKVLYVDVFGEDPSTGKEVREHIVQN